MTVKMLRELFPNKKGLQLYIILYVEKNFLIIDDNSAWAVVDYLLDMCEDDYTLEEWLHDTQEMYPETFS